MKILFISQFAGSPNHGMVTRNYNWGVELLRQGHDVTIVASAYSHYRAEQPEMSGKFLKPETIDGIKYLWLQGPTYDGNNGLGRIMSMITFSRRMMTVINRIDQNFDLVVASSPQPFVIYPAHKIAKRCGAKLIYDIRDLWPLTLKEIGGISKWHPFIMALQHAENYACRHADLVTAVPQNCKNYLIDHGMKEYKFLHVGNGHVIQEHKSPTPLQEEHSSLLKKLKDKNKFVIGYAGTHGRANAMHVAIKALKKTNNPNIHLIMVGKGARKASLKETAIDESIHQQVHFLDAIDHSQIPTFLSKIDVAYIGGISSPLYKHGCSPAKMNDYLFSEKPILYAMGDPNNPIEQSNCGLCCEAENIDQLATAMNEFHQMSTTALKTMGSKGREWLLKNQLVSIQVNEILKKLS